MTKERVTITIDDRLLARIDKLAKSSGTPRSALIERLMEEAVTEEEMVQTPEVQSMLRTISSPKVIDQLDLQLGEYLDEDQKRAVSRRLSSLRGLTRRPPKGNEQDGSTGDQA